MRKSTLGVVAALALLIPALARAAASSFSIPDYTVSEKAGVLIANVCRTTTSGSAKITIQTAGLTAKSGTDYVAVSKNLTFSSGLRCQPVSIQIINDQTYEPTETFQLVLTAVSNAVITRSRGTVTITDDDPVSTPPPPTTTWTKCADEGQLCRIVGTAVVRYGSGTTYFTRTVTDQISCDNATWAGDPTPNVFKHCDTNGAVPTPPPPPVQCPDGSTVPAGQTCPPPPPTGATKRCPDGSVIAFTAICAGSQLGTACMNGYPMLGDGTCPPLGPTMTQCPDGTYVLNAAEPACPPIIPGGQWVAAPITEGGYVQVVTAQPGWPKYGMIASCDIAATGGVWTIATRCTFNEGTPGLNYTDSYRSTGVGEVCKTYIGGIGYAAGYTPVSGLNTPPRAWSVRCLVDGQSLILTEAKVRGVAPAPGYTPPF